MRTECPGVLRKPERTAPTGRWCAKRTLRVLPRGRRNADRVAASVITVSNSSPIINLARIGKLDLLRQIFGTVTVPDAVWREVVVDGAGQAGARDVEQASWIRRATVKNRDLVRALQQELDEGESEAIALACETQGSLLLMDENLGRENS